MFSLTTVVLFYLAGLLILLLDDMGGNERPYS